MLSMATNKASCNMQNCLKQLAWDLHSNVSSRRPIQYMRIYNYFEMWYNA